MRKKQKSSLKRNELQHLMQNVHLKNFLQQIAFYNYVSRNRKIL